MQRFQPIFWLLCGMFVATACEAQLPTGGGAASGDATRDQEGRRGDDPKPDDESIHAPFDGILRACVREERVDYLAVRDQHFGSLGSYLDALSRVEPKKLGSKERLAFYINLYNATMIRAVAERLVDGYTVAANEYAIFDEKLVRIASGKVSLNALENEIIRKRFTEPRIHVALVCGARSCPPILPRAYEADDLDGVLAANMKRFVNDPFRNRVSKGKAQLSHIFDWYKDDFGGADGVVDYVSRYTEVSLRGVKPTFLDYSWDLNIAKPSKGRWVIVSRAASGLRKGEYVEVASEDGGQLVVRRPFGKGEARVAATATRAY